MNEDRVTLTVAARTLRRGDVIHFKSGLPDFFVWRTEGIRAYAAKGWRLWYLRFVYNPLRMAWRFVVNLCVLAFERPENGGADA